MKRLSYIILALLSIITAACSADDQFRVNGTIEGKPTMNLRAGYYADGKYKTVITAVREGEFEFFGSAGQPSILEITDYDYRPIARLYVVNGETYDVSLEQGRPYSVKASGNPVNERWSEFLRTNEKSLLTDDANKTIASYVTSHTDDIVSTILMLTEYNASVNIAEADSLFSSITPAARPSSLTEGYSFLMDRVASALAGTEVPPMKYLDRNDSLMSFNPAKQEYSLIVMSTQANSRTDSLIPVLRRLSKKWPSKRLQILDFSLDSDTSAWKRSAKRDSATWKQGWVAGGLAGMSVDKLGAPSLPYLIVCDSTGSQLLRTPHTGVAENYLNSTLSR